MNQLTTEDIKRAVAKHQNSLMSGQMGTLYGTTFVNSVNAPSTGVFNAVEDQVKRYKKNVISKEVLKSKHDKLYADVDKEMDMVMETQAFKDCITKATIVRMRREVIKAVYSRAFQAKIEKAAMEVLANGIK